jgi:hypothetical protein
VRLMTCWYGVWSGIIESRPAGFPLNARRVGSTIGGLMNRVAEYLLEAGPEFEGSPFEVDDVAELKGLLASAMPPGAKLTLYRVGGPDGLLEPVPDEDEARARGPLQYYVWETISQVSESAAEAAFWTRFVHEVQARERGKGDVSWAEAERDGSRYVSVQYIIYMQSEDLHDAAQEAMQVHSELVEAAEGTP